MKRPSKKKKSGDFPEVTEVNGTPTNGAEPSRLADDGPTQPYVQVPDFSADTTAVDEPAPEAPAAEITDESSWDGPTRPGGVQELADLVARAAEQPAEGAADTSEGAADAIEVEAPGMTAAEGQGDGDGAAAQGEGDGQGQDNVEGDPDAPAVESPARLESIIESLLFASDRPLSVADLKRLLGERDTKKVSSALEALKARHDETGVQLSGVAGGWQFRTHPQNGPWVSKLVAAKPQRLSRALLETLAIVAYRQPITRPEIDEIRGVDCGPVLKTLLDRGLVRMIGKKEDVGRPILYGTTPEFLRTFSLKDLAELPTLREFHELSAQQMAEVDAKTEAQGGPAGGDGAAAGGPAVSAPAPVAMPRVDPEEEERLIDELDRATAAAAKATAAPPDKTESQPQAGADGGPGGADGGGGPAAPDGA